MFKVLYPNTKITDLNKAKDKTIIFVHTITPTYNKWEYAG